MLCKDETVSLDLWAAGKGLILYVIYWKSEYTIGEWDQGREEFVHIVQEGELLK